MSWPQILSILAVGFVHGALWHRAHARDRRRNEISRRAQHVEMLPTRRESTTAYAYGRREIERVTR
jgi:hypothetical protein